MMTLHFSGPCCDSDSFCDSAHYIRNRVKFRRICKESSEHNWADISETICPQIIVFGKLDVVLSEYPDKFHNFTNLMFMTSSLYNSTCTCMVSPCIKDDTGIVL